MRGAGEHVAGFKLQSARKEELVMVQRLRMFLKRGTYVSAYRASSSSGAGSSSTTRHGVPSKCIGTVHGRMRALYRKLGSKTSSW